MTSRRNPLAVGILTSLALLAAAPVFAQSTTTTSNDDTKTETAKSVGKVTVVGSRIKRAKVEGAAPVTVINRDQMEREGFAQVGDMLQTMTQTTTTNFTGDLAVSGFTPNAQVVNLRSLGPGYTLTLVDGRRPAQYPQPYNNSYNVVNVRAIPSSIIERSEILSGGASAIYGSDAVAGVVNIVTRKNFNGNRIALRVGTTEEGGGNNWNVEYTGGKTSDKWNAIWALQTGKTDPIFATQRWITSDTRHGPLGATTNPGLSLIAIRVTNTAPAGKPSNLNQNAYYPGQAVCDRFGYTTVTTAARGQYCGSFETNATRSLQNLSKYWSAYGRAERQIGENGTVWGSMTYYQTQAKSSSGTEFWGTSGDQFMRSSQGAQLPYYYDVNMKGMVQLQRVLNGFELGGLEATTTVYDEKTYELNAGITGNIADRFDWELSGQHGIYDYKADRPRMYSKAVHDYFLGPMLGYVTTTGVKGLAGSIYPSYALNTDRWNTPLDPATYAGISTRVINRGQTKSEGVSFTMSGDLFKLPAGPVGFAGVVEAYRQTLEINSDPRIDQARAIDAETIYNLVGSGLTRGVRSRYAMGGEFRVPLTKNITGQLAGRYDQYDDITKVGGKFTYNLGLEYRPAESLLLRTSYATSFKAPDMQYVFSQGNASFGSVLDQYACYTGTGAADGLGPRTLAQCNVSGDRTIYSAQTRTTGNPGLLEETSKSFGAGFVWDVTDNLNMTMDYYRIRLYSAASRLSASTILRAEAACRMGAYQPGVNLPPPSAAYCDQILASVVRTNAPGTALDGRLTTINSTYINTAAEDTDGIDASLNFRQDLGRFGNMRYNLGYTMVLSDKYAQLQGDVMYDYRDTSSVAQRSRARGSVNWSKNTWSATYFFTRLGSAVSAAGISGSNVGGVYQHRLSPWTLSNVVVSKRFGDNLTTTFTINNLTNTQYRQDFSETGYPYFDAYIGADLPGRRYSLQVAYKF